jgi:hypothetical protein
MICHCCFVGVDFIVVVVVDIFVVGGVVVVVEAKISAQNSS